MVESYVLMPYLIEGPVGVLNRITSIDRGGERRCVQQSEVYALAELGAHRVGRIANEHEPVNIWLFQHHVTVRGEDQLIRMTDLTEQRSSVLIQ